MSLETGCNLLLWKVKETESSLAKIISEDLTKARELAQEATQHVVALSIIAKNYHSLIKKPIQDLLNDPTDFPFDTQRVQKFVDYVYQVDSVAKLDVDKAYCLRKVPFVTLTVLTHFLSMTDAWLINPLLIAYFCNLALQRPRAGFSTPFHFYIIL